MKKPIKRRILAVSLTALLFLSCVSLWQSLSEMTVTEYVLHSRKVTEPIRVVQLSDLHDNTLLINNDRLVDKVAELKPDLVLLTGDLLNFNSESDAPVLSFIKALSAVAPVYVSAGNHEIGYMRGVESDNFLDKYQAAGAVVLNSRYADVTVKGQALRIGGVYGAVYNQRHLPDEVFRGTNTYRFLTAFEDTNALKLLMCHKPEHLLDETDSTSWDIDLAFSGHEHGGQVRLPLIGGFYSTHLGWFSPYLDGVHMLSGIPVVISRGLGTYTWSAWGLPIPPRFCNPPEIVLVTIDGEAY